MTFSAKHFDELSSRELYEILKARVNIFVVEQRCAYPDLDDIDYRSLHLYSQENGRIKAYLRAYEMEPGVVRMGRVLTIERGKGHGAELLKKGIEEIKRHFDPKYIYIEAQSYAVGFYRREGFEICSDEFFEDGIAHVAMKLKMPSEEA